MRFGTYDIEANGFLPEVDTIHCMVLKDYFTKEVFRFYEGSEDGSVVDGVEAAFQFDVLSAHNGIGYDFLVIKELLGKEFSGGIIDTLIWSQTLNPDRQLPPNCPTSYKNPITGRLDKVTPHSLAAWGYRVGRGKPEHYDWTTFSPEMLVRCEEDVEIQELTLDMLVEEAGIDLSSYLEEIVK